METKYTYGPVPSRRLRFSLGIDLIPFKYCSFDCIYCQLGKTTNKTIVRKEYFPTQKILKDVKAIIKKGDNIDYLTFSGSGEPTLHSGIGYLISELKKITKIPVAVLTNSSLLFIPAVQEELSNADVVLPTLCAVSQEIFNKINRPIPDATIEKIIHGLISFRKIYKGKIWLEIMLIKGINDEPHNINKLKEIVKKIAPDKIHLNTAVRPPSEKYALPLSIEELQRVENIFGDNTEIIASFNAKRESAYLIDTEKIILDMMQRRPITLEDICSVTGLHRNEVLKYLDQLHRAKKVKLTEHDNRNYYEIL
jgi:wyosine [tRNA(Phe)-imidazoG37] synthetase (radical SAM superfamily)